MSIDLIETAKAGWAVIAPLAAGTGVWAYLGGRTPKSSAPAEITGSQAALVLAVNKQTETILIENTRLRRESNSERRRLTNAVKRISDEVAECNGRHRECEIRVIDLTDEVAFNRAEIIRMMKQTGVALSTEFNPADPRFKPANE